MIIRYESTHNYKLISGFLTNSDGYQVHPFLTQNDNESIMDLPLTILDYPLD